jgi:hypothetical protein
MSESNVSEFAYSKPYSVTLYGSHPNNDQGDDWIVADFDTREEALAASQEVWKHFDEYYKPITQYICVDGPDICRLVENPGWLVAIYNGTCKEG